MSKVRLFGSLNNRLMEASQQVTPEVGMGATILMYSDRHAVTIVAVTPKRIIVQQDKAIRTDTNGMSDSQSYRYEPNPDALAETFTLRKDGSWVREGESLRSGTRIAIGYRDEHYDFGF